MAFVDPIGDMITRIRNAQMRSLSSVKIPGSKFRASILDVLKKEGYISDYKFLTDVKDKNSLTVSLKYDNGNPVIKEIKRVSKPGRRIYAKADSIPIIQNGLGLAIVNKVISDHNSTILFNSIKDGAKVEITLQKYYD